MTCPVYREKKERKIFSWMCFLNTWWSYWLHACSQKWNSTSKRLSLPDFWTQVPLNDGEVSVEETGFPLQVQERIGLQHDYSPWANSSNTCTYLQVFHFIWQKRGSVWLPLLKRVLPFLFLSPLPHPCPFSLNTIYLSLEIYLSLSLKLLNINTYLILFFIFIESHKCS